MRIGLKVALDTMSGYGNDGLGLTRELHKQGHDVHLIPFATTPPIDPLTARLLTKMPTPPYDLTLIHLFPSGLEVGPLRNISRRVVSWTMWEYENYRDVFDPETGETWVAHRDHFRKAVEGTDLLLAYDEVTKSALGDPDLIGDIPVKILQGGYDPEFWLNAPQTRDWGSTFRFGMLGRMDRRKNPWAAIRAFSALKAEYGPEFDAELHIKTNTPNLPHQISELRPGVVIHYDWWDQLRIREFYAGIHCFVAPSTGEGKNVPCLEAQTTGAPVIATDYSGHRQWLREDWGYPLNWAPHEFSDAGWAAMPDEDHLKKLMWHVYSNREEARLKGEKAARVIPQMCSWSHVVGQLMDVIKTVPEQEPAWKPR